MHAFLDDPPMLDHDDAMMFVQEANGCADLFVLMLKVGTALPNLDFRFGSTFDVAFIRLYEGILEARPSTQPQPVASG